MQGLWCGLMVGLPRKLKLCARFVVWSHGWTTKEDKALCMVCGVVSWLDYQEDKALCKVCVVVSWLDYQGN